MNFRKVFTVGVAILAICAVSVPAAFAQPDLLDPTTQTKFVNQLPVLRDLGLRIWMPLGGYKRVKMVELEQPLGLQVPNTLNPLGPTTVWGYQFPGKPATYPGATIVTHRNRKVWIKWENHLPNADMPTQDAHLLPVDTSLHWAHPTEGIPTVTHLHGGHTESASDGLPEAWFTQRFMERGDYFVKKTYRYDNTQESGTLWYHDHALGITRLNVYAGLAGFYLLRDPNENLLRIKRILPGGPYEIEIVIQDRMFTDAGQLFYPAFPGDPAWDDFITDEGVTVCPDTPPDPELNCVEPPSALAEFFGDFILVNGMAWPKLSVEPRKYRLRLLNGSDSRFYILQFGGDVDGTGALPFLQIGTDDGFLNEPVPLTQLPIAPGERADVVVDFSVPGMGSNVIVKNFGPDEPFGGGTPVVDFDPADPATTGQIMQFTVDKPFSRRWPYGREATVGLGTDLRRWVHDIVLPPDTSSVDETRQLVLFEGTDDKGRLQPILGTLVDGSLAWFEDITELPNLGDTEVWEIYNATGDAHPIHLHLVAFQIINRESFTGVVVDKPQPQHDGEVGTGGRLTNVILGNDARDPEPNEMGPKDTVVMLPGEVTRVIATFDRPGRYVWHCHILSHEDHEMMRPYEVVTP